MVSEVADHIQSALLLVMTRPGKTKYVAALASAPEIVDRNFDPQRCSTYALEKKFASGPQAANENPKPLTRTRNADEIPNASTYSFNKSLAQDTRAQPSRVTRLDSMRRRSSDGEPGSAW